MPGLDLATVVYVAPRLGAGGVGDYAEALIGAARRRAGRVVEVRHGGPGDDDVAEIRATRRAVRDAVAAAAPDGPVVVHAELSGGVLAPFWSLAGLDATVRSATIHDAPLAAWTPLRTRTVSRSRLVTHGLHFPIMPVHRAIERRVLSGVRLSALTESGAAATERELGHEHVVRSFNPPPARPPIAPALERPPAIGLFGYVYKGKGFERIRELRDATDASVAIRIAGRGTEHLPAIDGVDILGPVEGEALDAYFASIRAIVLPYSRRSSYGPETLIASGVIANAIAYRTPVVARSYPGLMPDEAEVVDGDIDELGRRAAQIVLDDEAIARLAGVADRLAAERTPDAAFDRIASGWRELS